MQNDFRCAKIIIRDGWVICPVCGRGKVLKCLPETTGHNIVIYCKRCGQEAVINIDKPVPVPSARA